jgi:type I restriction enzyme S subunit
LEWLGEVPAHWETCRFSREIAICEGLVDPETEPFASRLLIAIAPEDCLCSADMYPLDGGRRVHNPYLCWVLLSTPFVAWSVLESDRVAMPKINRETLR